MLISDAGALVNTIENKIMFVKKATEGRINRKPVKRNEAKNIR